MDNQKHENSIAHVRNTVVGCFLSEAECDSHKPALIDAHTCYTYAQLVDKVFEYTAKLQSLGVEKGDVVAVHLDRSAELVLLQLAVLNAGAVFLPVDKRYPLTRIDYLCRDCSVKLLITDTSLHLCDINIIHLTNFKNVQATACARSVINDGVCYIIYTSGSTGTPKGCMLTNSGLVNFCKNNNTLATLSKMDMPIFACVNSVSFDYFIAESLLPLTNGFTTVILDDNESTVQEQFLEVVRRNNINVIMTTPTRLKIFYSDQISCNPLKYVECICSAGEPLPPELLEIMYRKSPLAQVYNPLGPSECTVWNVGGELDRMAGIDIHIGKPIANTQIYIVDKFMNIVPIGVTGELCIAGAGVGAGYLNRPELSAEKFIDNPFGEGKLYKTGDLAYWREDGNIAYVGRNDFQVKIRGLRIELGEIENAIAAVDGITQAVVVVRKNSQGRQLICAFYTGDEVDAKEIRSSIGKKLPKYMLPHIFTHLDELPLTSSGKTNRKALPKVDLESITNEAQYIKPENNRQKLLCEIMEQILDISPVGIEDDFFDLGGDSLKAIEFVSKAHNEGVYFNLQNIFDHPTVKALCDSIENGEQETISFDDVDFTEVNKILKRNTEAGLTKPPQCDVGNILLAGATGYLGMHILADFLERDTGTAYCLVRGKSKMESEARLAALVDFYFKGKYNGSDRIRVICADLQKDLFGLDEVQYNELLGKADTVINAAASVKHYGIYKYFYETNVETVKRLVDFCKVSKAKFIHISTLTVSGNGFSKDASSNEMSFTEQNLYIGQPLENVYARSKFEAEKVVLDAMSLGLQANIMRMGNLTNRSSDGVFQQNYESNAFLKRLRAFIKLGVYPIDAEGFDVEFTPIDEAARAVMTLTRHFANNQTVFHISNPNTIKLKNVFALLREMGCSVMGASYDKFVDRLQETVKQQKDTSLEDAFIEDLDSGNRIRFDSNIVVKNEFTVQHLKTLDFEWSHIGKEYLMKYVAYLKSVGCMGE